MIRWALTVALAAAALLGAPASAAAQPPTIYIQNQTTVLSDSIVAGIVPVFQQAVSDDFEPYWGMGANLVFVPQDAAIPDGGMQLILGDYSDDPYALGYHKVSADGTALAYAFVRTDIEYLRSWEVTATHELFEMLADPWINRAVWDGFGRLTFMEVSDPVESDRFLYYRQGGPEGLPVQISDFVTPAWYSLVGQPPYDFAAHVHAPLKLLYGGYANVWRKGWWWEVDGPGFRKARAERARQR